jgi:hypothetical protein
MEAKEHYTSALICRDFRFENKLRTAVEAMIAESKAQGL